MSPDLRYSEDELREQWSFIDALVESQAAALRSGAQDPEEETPGPQPAPTDLAAEVESLRDRVRVLEADRESLLERIRGLQTERDSLRERLRTPHPQGPLRVAAPPPARPLESRVREWWRRLSR